jgi:hypothetical protein
VSTPTSQAKSIALQIIEHSTLPADIYWASEVECASVEYQTDAKVFTFDDGSRIRVDPNFAELLP